METRKCTSTVGIRTFNRLELTDDVVIDQRCHVGALVALSEQSCSHDGMMYRSIQHSKLSISLRSTLTYAVQSALRWNAVYATPYVLLSITPGYYPVSSTGQLRVGWRRWRLTFILVPCRCLQPCTEIRCIAAPE